MVLSEGWKLHHPAADASALVGVGWYERAASRLSSLHYAECISNSTLLIFPSSDILARFMMVCWWVFRAGCGKSANCNLGKDMMEKLFNNYNHHETDMAGGMEGVQASK